MKPRSEIPIIDINLFEIIVTFQMNFSVIFNNTAEYFKTNNHQNFWCWKNNWQRVCILIFPKIGIHQTKRLVQILPKLKDLPKCKVGWPWTFKSNNCHNNDEFETYFHALFLLQIRPIMTFFYSLKWTRKFTRKSRQTRAAPFDHKIATKKLAISREKGFFSAKFKRTS